MVADRLLAPFSACICKFVCVCVCVCVCVETLPEKCVCEEGVGVGTILFQ